MSPQIASPIRQFRSFRVPPCDTSETVTNLLAVVAPIRYIPGMVKYFMTHRGIAFAILFALGAVAAIVVSAQEGTKSPTRPRATGASSEIVVLAEPVVRDQWAPSLGIVSLPTGLSYIQAGQCVRFGIYATGAHSEELLRSATFEFELHFDGNTQRVPPESAAEIKRIRPQGGESISQIIGHELEASAADFDSMAASRFRWCANSDVRDGKLIVSGRATLHNGKSVALGSTAIDVMTFDSVRAKWPFDKEKFDGWVQAYHNSPDPAHLYPAIQYRATDPEALRQLNVMAFFVAALKASPEALAELAHRVDREPSTSKVYMLVILKLAGYDIKPLASGIGQDDVMAIEAISLPSFDGTAGQTIGWQQDILWASFFATGDFNAVKTMASMLAWKDDYKRYASLIKEKKAPREMTVSYWRGIGYLSAGWSILALSQSDEVVADYVQALEASPDTPEVVRRELENRYSNPAFRR